MHEESKKALAIQAALMLPGHSETSRAALEIAMLCEPGQAREFLSRVSECATLSGESAGGAGAEALRRAAVIVAWRDNDEQPKGKVLALVNNAWAWTVVCGLGTIGAWHANWLHAAHLLAYST